MIDIFFKISNVQQCLFIHEFCKVCNHEIVLLTKDSPRNEISYDFQPPFSLHISNLEPSPQGLISSVIYCFCLPLPSEFTVHQEWTILYFTLPCIIDRPPYQSINQSEKKLPIKNTLFSRST